METENARRAGVAAAVEMIVHPRVGTKDAPGAEIGDHGTGVAIVNAADPATEIGEVVVEIDTGVADLATDTGDPAAETDTGDRGAEIGDAGAGVEIARAGTGDQFLLQEEAVEEQTQSSISAMSAATLRTCLSLPRNATPGLSSVCS